MLPEPEPQVEQQLDVETGSDTDASEEGRCMMDLFASALSDSDDEAMPVSKMLTHEPSGCTLRAFGMEFGQTTGCV